MIRISRSIVPNFFTIGNMFCGYLAILFAAYSKNHILAAWMIILAAFFDSVDGKIARFTNSSSKFGVEYDSLADVVSFGVAPSVLIYEFYLSGLQVVGSFLSFLPLLFGSIRLARFNVQLSGLNKSYFKGLPSPAAAITISAYVLFVNQVFTGQIFPRVLIVTIFCVSLLMVSNVRYEVLPAFSLKGNFKQKLLFTGLIIAGILLVINPQMFLFPFMIVYIMSGIIVSLFIQQTRRRMQKDKT